MNQNLKILTQNVLTGYDLLDGGQSDIMVSEEHRIGIVLHKRGKAKQIKSRRDAKQITLHLWSVI